MEHSSFTIVNIHIQDKNSYAPQFERDIYVIQVAESAKSGAVIGKINANDLDSGENARLTYLMDPETENEIKKYFSIDQTSGSISLLLELDNEQKKYYVFSVICYDHGIPQKKDTSVVEIRVLGESDKVIMNHELE